MLDFELGALSPSAAEFYARLGWEVWRGPLSARTPTGMEPSPDNECVMIRRLPHTPSLTAIAQSFIARELLASIAFHRDRLGFDLAFITPPDDPYFAIARRDDIEIMLKAILPEVLPTPNHSRHSWARWDAVVGTDAPDELSREFIARGVTFRTPLGVDGDNLRLFEVADHDGYVLFFGRPA